MKKAFSIAAASASLLLQSAFGQITFSGVPSNSNVAQGGTFTVQIRLSITGTTPADVAGYNLWLETAAANSGLFSIVSATSNQPGFDTPSGSFGGNEFLTTSGSTHSGFAQNANSVGFIDGSGGANAFPTPVSNVLLETLTLSTNGAPLGSYTFAITNAATSAPRSTGVNDSNGNFFKAQTTGSFTVSVVPEPATGLLLTLGGISSLGLTLLRWRRQKS